ncbi:MAG: aspartate aminotransferase family protein [Deltaproteobacteria bacterium HGW-Deltaproteobacteria-6]|nr:MAG: aspartate aminotransferase family protein [Deltaproteobacteria bacterium HGW-Deltaproteobacteria-6]
METLQEQLKTQMEDKTLFEQARRYACDYMDKVPGRNVFPTRQALQSLNLFKEPMPAKPAPPADILNMLHTTGSPATVAQTGGRYFGFVCGGAIPAALASKWLSDVWDQNAGLYIMSPVASELESLCEIWISDLLGLPQNTAAGLVSGTSTALLCALVAARNDLLTRMGWDVAGKGLFGAPEIRVIAGEQAHASVFKALSFIGLGRDRVILVPADGQGRMIPEKVPALDQNTLLILQAGNVNSGAFDPFEPLCSAAEQARAWVHVDGAFGLWAAACQTRAHLTAGMEKADSWSVDAHKTLNAPYDCGIVLCRSREALAQAMQATGSYITYSAHRDGMLYTPEMSRRARAVDLWATLKALGREGIDALVEGLCQRAQQFAEGLRAEGFRILNDVVFNQVLVACATPELTRLTLEAIQSSGTCWCGGSTWKGEPVIRISVCSWATTASDVECSIAAFIEARSVASGKTPGAAAEGE